ncbi:Leucyl aminopeptidase (aminopeptidase T) [Maridesulfovibrio ferrireducens]|uniref:Leucyl aminopeptidase (Aminopeptidase T) n=1 Tax=Maridesulfovibrio ferrireducens TaxID=246191 RepID=A0A1G9GWP9_9BACT|nr:aminopeptidase [Maridesulfovibrio ferrireducens]SDL05111.1 Leucyl aminopeptidase (aminopeptidase T) [Maridesulfovibrio ferrireducens]
MLTEKQLEKYVEALWWGLTTARTKPYEKGDVIMIRYEAEALPLAEVVFKRLIDEGLNPVSRLSLTPSMEKSFYGSGNDDQVTFIAPGDEELTKKLNGLIVLLAPSSLTHLADVDPSRIGKSAVARKFIRDIMDIREQEGELGWTLCSYPTKAMAESAGLSIEDFTAQIVKACYLDDEDPAASWKGVFNKATEVKDWLNGLDIESYRIVSEGMDLTVLHGEMRQWIGVSGHNIPSFELFISPDWRGTSGVFYADQPSFRSGNYVEGVKLTFENGVVTNVSAKEGEDFVKKQIAMDPGASRLGEFSLTDRRFSRIDKFMANTLYDENYGGEFGNSHVAVGASYADTYAGDQTKLDAELKEKLGYNSSALHWDLVNTLDKTVYAKLKDGREVVIYAKGEFQL